MRVFLLDFISRFRRARPQDPRKPRTMAQSQVEDLEHQDPDTPEREAFDEYSFQKTRHSLDHPFGTSSHGGDNPTREDDLKHP